MPYFLTLIASRGILSTLHLAAIQSMLDEFGIAHGAPVWLHTHKAADIPISQRPNRQQIEQLWNALSADRIDAVVTPAQGRRKKLLIADMDATIVTTETLDELAAHAGIADKVSAITARAMKGELDFAQALKERVAMLGGLSEDVLRDVMADTILSDGAELLIRTMKRHGARCVLVSGGFTFFTGAVAGLAGFDEHQGNTLQIEDGKLTGEVREPILDKRAKLETLQAYCISLGLNENAALALGDGANDLPMLLSAGLGIGYRPKPLLQDALDNCLFYADLTAALYAQGFRMEEIFD